MAGTKHMKWGSKHYEHIYKIVIFRNEILLANFYDTCNSKPIKIAVLFFSHLFKSASLLQITIKLDNKARYLTKIFRTYQFNF